MTTKGIRYPKRVRRWRKSEQTEDINTGTQVGEEVPCVICQHLVTCALRMKVAHAHITRLLPPEDLGAYPSPPIAKGFHEIQTPIYVLCSSHLHDTGDPSPGVIRVYADAMLHECSRISPDAGLTEPYSLTLGIDSHRCRIAAKSCTLGAPHRRTALPKVCMRQERVDNRQECREA